MSESRSCLVGEKYLWSLPQAAHGNVLDLARRYNLSIPIMQTLVGRGISSGPALESYLFSTLERDVADPLLLKDAQKAIDRILEAIHNKEKILICGDYDVDGITSSAMMMLCLLPLGAQVNFFLPHRVRDGYGLSTKIIERAAKNGYKVAITVDNGITAFQAADSARALGIDLIITDHHRPHDQLPDAYAIINPHQDSCLYPYKKFAGVGVTFKVLSLLYKQINKVLPSKVYELLLLGTIADVVPLTGENRFWVRYGLQHINTKESLPLRVLKQNARFTKPTLSSTDIGFFITPQINALGRLEDAREGVKFLLGSDSKEVERVGSVLKELNEARKAIEKSVLGSIEDAINAKKIDLEQERIILASSHEWQPGVIGLVASRLVGAYNRPALLFHITKDTIAKGSCRSIEGFNIFEALHEHKDLLLSFGGHAMAAGLSLQVDKLQALKERLEATIRERIPVFERKPTMKLDAELSLGEANKKLVADLAYLEPFGNENAQPVFYIKEVTLLENPVILKDAHVKCMLFKDGIIKPVIFFNRPELYPLLLQKRNETLHVAAYVTENHWNGKVSVELQGVDISI